ncbi:MAG TPA: glycosyltransferase family 39 protein, partial [Caldilineae bacterium]|nr:glycosyltransferase family 39 protein [Caldilineae bacterium]
MMMRTRWQWLILAIFLGLALLLSYPLALRFATHTPGTDTWAFDESTFLWNIWYFKHALLDLRTSPLHSELIWYPLGIDLILYTYNFFNALVGLPLLLAWGLVPASNATLILATALSGYGAYLLARQLLADRRWLPSGPAGHLIPLIAGLIYAFGSNRAVYAALGHYDMVTTQWIPFYTLYLVRTLRRPGWRDAALAGLFFALAALAEMIFAVFLGILTLMLVAFHVLSVARASISGDEKRRAVTSLVGRLAVLAAVAAILWGPVLVPIVREFISGDYALEGWGEGLKLSTDLLGFITPTALHPIWGEDWRRALRAVEEGTARFSDINTVFIGWITLALALVGAAVTGKWGRPWRWVALLFGAFCLGPLLQINGRYEFSLDHLLGDRGVTFPMPFALLHYIPFVRANRAPNRNSVILMLGVAVLAAYAIAWCARKVGRRGLRARVGYVLTVVLAAGILFEHAAVPAPLTDARVPPIYEQLAREPGEFAILQLPLGWRNSFGVFGSERTQVQYYQTVHGKPILGGNISRAPEFKMAYFRRLPLFQAITETEFGRPVPPEVDAAARAQAAGLMYLYDVRYLIILPPIPGRFPYADTYAATRDYVLSVLPVEPEPIYDRDGVQAYRVRQPAGRPDFALDLGVEGSAAYRGEGWHDDEQIFGATANWVGAREARLFLPVRLDTPAPAYRLSLRVHPFDYPGASPQTMRVIINGQEVGEPVTLAPAWEMYWFQIPPGTMRSGLNRVTLAFAWTARPRDVFPADVRIGQTGV